MCISWKSNNLFQTTEDDDGLIATGGLDGTVKVWSSRTTGLQPKPLRTLNTIFGVQNVKWRKDHSTQLVVLPHSVTSLNRQSVSELDHGKSWRNELELWDIGRESVPLSVLRPEGGVISG